MWRQVNGMDREEPNTTLTRDEFEELKSLYPDTVH